MHAQKDGKGTHWRYGRIEIQNASVNVHLSCISRFYGNKVLRGFLSEKPVSKYWNALIAFFLLYILTQLTLIWYGCFRRIRDGTCSNRVLNSTFSFKMIEQCGNHNLAVLTS